MIAFKADANDENPVNWTQTITISESDLDALYARLVQIGAFSKTWQQVENIPDGGSADELSVTAYINGDDQARDMHAVYGEIEALVPQEIWDEWYARHEEYIAENEE